MRVWATDDTGRELPIDSTLAEALVAWSEGGFWANAYDDQWRLVAQTAEQAAVTTGRLVNDKFQFGPDSLEDDLESATDGSAELIRAVVRHLGVWMLADLGVDRDGLREMLHPALRDVVDELEPCEASAVAWALRPT